MPYAEIYVHQVIGVPGSDVGHLPDWRGRDHTLCGRLGIEEAIERIEVANRNHYEANQHRPYREVVTELVGWMVEPEGRRPCRHCVRAADRQHLHRLQQIEAMGGRP